MASILLSDLDITASEIESGAYLSASTYVTLDTGVDATLVGIQVSFYDVSQNLICAVEALDTSLDKTTLVSGASEVFIGLSSVQVPFTGLTTQTQLQTSNQNKLVKIAADFSVPPTAGVAPAVSVQIGIVFSGSPTGNIIMRRTQLNRSSVVAPYSKQGGAGGVGGDADTLDGIDSTEFAQKAVSETITSPWIFNVDTTFNSDVDVAGQITGGLGLLFSNNASLLTLSRQTGTTEVGMQFTHGSGNAYLGIDSTGILKTGSTSALNASGDEIYHEGNFLKDTDYLGINNTPGGFVIGNNSNSTLNVRHIDGKNTTDNADDILYLNHSNGLDVYINGNVAHHEGNFVAGTDYQVAGDYVDLTTAQTITGLKSFSANTTFTASTYWQVSGGDVALQRADARDDETSESRLHWYGLDDSSSVSNFRHAWYDGASYINVTASAGTVDFDGNISLTGTVDGVDIATRDTDLSNLQASMFDVSDGSTTQGTPEGEELRFVGAGSIITARSDIGAGGSQISIEHVNTNGNRHIPAGGVVGQILENNAAGNAVWVAGNLAHTDFNETILGEWDFTNITKGIGSNCGIDGRYSSTGSTGTWGGTIWALDSALNGTTSGTTYLPTSLYGACWLRGSNTETNANVGEGLHIYQNGVLQGGLGSVGLYVKGNVSIQGNITSSNSYNGDCTFNNDLVSTNLLQVSGLFDVDTDIEMSATNRLYFDGGPSGGGGDTYIHEVSANNIEYVANGSVSCGMAPTGIGLPIGNKLYFDGSGADGNDYIEANVNNNVRIVASGTERFNVNSSGVQVVGTMSATTIDATSDINKKNLRGRYINSKVDSIPARLWTWKDKSLDQSTQVGYIAQEVESVIPEAVGTAEDGSLTLNYAAVHTAKIAALEAKVARLLEILDDRTK